MFQMYGVVPPMITPFQENGEVDYDSLKTLVGFLSENVDGLFITGSYGGGALMTEEERRGVAETTINTASGRLPVIVHVGTADSLSAGRLVDHAAVCGAAAVAAVGPYYFKHSKDEICNYFDALVKAAKGRLPVYVYNNPQFQGYPMDMDTIQALRDKVGVSGVKDATFDIQTMAKYLRLLKMIPSTWPWEPRLCGCPPVFWAAKPLFRALPTPSQKFAAKCSRRGWPVISKPAARPSLRSMRCGRLCIWPGPLSLPSTPCWRSAGLSPAIPEPPSSLHQKRKKPTFETVCGSLA